jgi:hypothetical protein
MFPGTFQDLAVGWTFQTITATDSPREVLLLRTRGVGMKIPSKVGNARRLR